MGSRDVLVLSALLLRARLLLPRSIMTRPTWTPCVYKWNLLRSLAPSQKEMLGASIRKEHLASELG